MNMYGRKLLRGIGLVMLFLFTFFVLSADFNFVQAQENEEDILLKARRLYQEGDYEGSIKLLSDFIQKLRAMVEQKKNVAEAFYLLAKIYYEVGDDTKVDENLEKVFETFPAFTAEEANPGFKERVKKIREKVLEAKEKELEKEKEAVAEEPEPEERVIERPTPVKAKKKKKFPVLLVVGGIAVAALIVVLASGKKKKEQEEEYNIVGNWIIYENINGESLEEYITFSGSRTSGTFVDQDGLTGTYSVSGRNVNFSYDFGLWFTYNGTFTGRDTMSGTWDYVYEGVPLSGTWTGERGGPGGGAQATSGTKATTDVKKLFK
jgi:tetratricopeptide (TPR) repeat protein